jgi:hypothetical protein
MKYVVYYRVPGGTKVNRAYPDYSGSDVKAEFLADGSYRGKIYLQHEPHDDYVLDFAPMVGKDESLQRAWLEQRVHALNSKAQAAAQAKLANVIPAQGNVYGASKPGDIVRDQHGRSGRVPQVPLEVFRNKPINPDTTMDAVRDFCKGGGGTIPRSN